MPSISAENLPKVRPADNPNQLSTTSPTAAASANVIILFLLMRWLPFPFEFFISEWVQICIREIVPTQRLQQYTRRLLMRSRTARIHSFLLETGHHQIG